MTDSSGTPEKPSLSPGARDPIPGASRMPPAPPEAIAAIAGAAGRLRSEAAEAQDAARKSRLLYEIGEIEERGGDEQAAARDYLQAYNADTEFREPLEGLVRLLERRRSLTNLGKLIEALVRAAETPEERVRALVAHAAFCADVQSDLGGARGVAREATEAGAGAHEAAAAWLLLEHTAGKLGDVALREEALEGRTSLPSEPRFRDLLRADLADLRAAWGDGSKAEAEYSALLTEKSAVSFRAVSALEWLLLGHTEGLEPREARARRARLAATLVRRGDMIHDACEDGAHGDATGVPRWMRGIAQIALAWVRAADVHSELGNIADAAGVLDRLLAVIDRIPREQPGITPLERVVMLRRMRIAELASETELSSQLAMKLLLSEEDPRERAALSMRVAEHAATLGDRNAALMSLGQATEADPQNLPARSLELDLLSEGDPTRFSDELGKFTAAFEVGDARARASLLSAFLLATEGGGSPEAIESAKIHVREAVRHGLAKDAAARFSRMLAALVNDHTFYDEATVELASAVTDEEAALLSFELARSRAARGDADGEKAALDMLGTLPAGAFVARAIEAFGSAQGQTGTAGLEAVEKLAALTESEDARRGLHLIASLRAQALGDKKRATDLLAKAGDSTLVLALRAEVAQAQGDLATAAELRARAAERADDHAVAAALDLEAGLTLFRAGQRSQALASFVRADERDGGAPSRLTAYASLSVSPDAIDARRAALDAAQAASLDPGVVTLDRFATEALGGDVERAREALANLDGAEKPDFNLAAALGRLLIADGDADDAIARIAASGEQGALFAAVERMKRARIADPNAHAEASSALLAAGGGPAAGLEWLAAAIRANDVSTEIAAREALSGALTQDHAEAMACSAAMFRALALEEVPPPVEGTSAAVRITNLELAVPGSAPARRATALTSLDGALGDAAETSAIALSAWNLLASGDFSTAMTQFQNVTTACPEDLASWEGLRLSAELAGNKEVYAMACEQLGARCVDDERGAAFWERAAATWLGLKTYEERADHALTAAITRDPRRGTSFDALFRRVRERKDGDGMLSLIQTRLEHAQEPSEIAKLYWEQARVLREKGDPEGALVALGQVTQLEPDHVGALALTGEIFIRRGMYEEAASHLARLARVASAPAKNRVTAGVTAVDLYENKLGRHDLALAVLVNLNRANLTTLPVRERLARAAARTGTWQEALPILEGLMSERETREGRVEAARLAMAIYRDKIQSPQRALPAVEKLLSEAPSDGEALDLLLALPHDSAERRRMISSGRDAILAELALKPGNPDSMRRLARIAQTLGDSALEQSALSASIALSGPEPIVMQALAHVTSRKGRVPQAALTESMMRALLAPEDDGAIAELFIALGPTLADALGPQLAQLGVTKKDRVDAKTGLAIRSEIASWAGAFGLPGFDLFVGGKDAFGVQGIPGETPAIVVGASVNAPLTPQMRGRVARELMGLIRGSTVTRWRDDVTMAAIVVAACNIAKVPVSAPPNAALTEVERQISREIPRKVKSLIEPICQKIVQTGQDPKIWAQRARASQSRAGLLASGDVSVVLADLLGEPLDGIAAIARDDVRAEELLRFMISPGYYELRRVLGLETAV
jgi:tetratricopeptide (TPR) repeat protein